MIYLLYSKDEYLITKRVHSIVSSLEVLMESVLSYDETTTLFTELVNEWNTISFFGDKRVFWIKNPDFLTKQGSLKDDELLLLQKYLKNPMETSILIFSSESITAENAVYQELRKYAKMEELIGNDQESMYQFARDYFKLYDLSIEEGTIAEIVSRITNYNSLNNELEKLAYYAIDKKKITLDIVDHVVPKNLEHKIYDLTNALLSVDKENMYRIYRDLAENNEEPLKILNNISSKLREILYVQKLVENHLNQEEIAKIFGISKGRAYYMLKNAKEVPYDSLVKNLTKISEIDYEIKSGQVDAFVALEFFLLGV